MCQAAEASWTSVFEKNSIPQVLEMPENNRVPFVVTWHHKLSALPKILHRNYETMVKKFQELKCIFPQPPVVAFRRNRNLKNLLFDFLLQRNLENHINHLHHVILNDASYAPL